MTSPNTKLEKNHSSHLIVPTNMHRSIILLASQLVFDGKDVFKTSSPCICTHWLWPYKWHVHAMPISPKTHTLPPWCVRTKWMAPILNIMMCPHIPHHLFQVWYTVWWHNPKIRVLDRFQGHFGNISSGRDTTVARHFNGCTSDNPNKFSSIQISVLDFIKAKQNSITAGKQRDKKEKHWIHQLHMVVPHLNLMDSFQGNMWWAHLVSKLM